MLHSACVLIIERWLHSFKRSFDRCSFICDYNCSCFMVNCSVVVFLQRKKIGANFTYMYCIFPIFMVFFFVLQLNDCVYLRCTRAHSRGILNQVYMLLTIESIRLIRISLGFFLSNEE